MPMSEPKINGRKSGMIRSIKYVRGKNLCFGEIKHKYLAGIVFADKDKLKELEKLVHPVVRQDFDKWTKNQQAAYVIAENAILHKSGMDKQVDLVIYIKADEKNRIKRVQQRDGIDEKAIKERLKNQDAGDFLLKNADFIIENNSSIADLLEKITEIDKNVKYMLKKR